MRADWEDMSSCFIRGVASLTMDDEEPRWLLDGWLEMGACEEEGGWLDENQSVSLRLPESTEFFVFAIAFARCVLATRRRR